MATSALAEQALVPELNTDTIDPAGNQAPAIDRELEAILQHVAHALRSPAWAIDSFTTLLMDPDADDTPEELHESYSRIKNAADRIQGHIAGLEALARISSHELQTQDLDLSELAVRVLRDVRQECEGRVIRASIQPGLTALGDPVMVREILRQLFLNACKFTSRESAPRLEFGSPGDPATGDGLETRRTFFVRDNGVGFDEARAYKLFCPFQRLHADPDLAGAGMGLAQVRRAVHRHGGRVWAEGEVDRGASFYFTLPCYPSYPWLDLHRHVVETASRVGS